jgi:catechol 2,3-dioxygenase-like lactoylglutathione lyase family enzyme
MIQCINHTGVSTPDLDRAIHFYCDLLGFELIQRFVVEKGRPGIDEMLTLEEASFEVALLRMGHAMIELFEFASPTPKRAVARRPVNDHGLTHLCLQVDDVKAEYERLSAAGMEFHREPQFREGIAYVYGRDPDGNAIELIEFDSTDHPFHVGVIE